MSIFSWFGGKEEAKVPTLAEQKALLKSYAAFTTGQDGYIQPRDFVILKPQDFTAVPEWSSYKFQRGPTFVMPYDESCDDTTEHTTWNIRIAYNNGTQIEIGKIDRRLLQRADVTKEPVDPLLQSFVEDEVNLSNCDVGTFVRARRGVLNFHDIYFQFDRNGGPAVVVEGKSYEHGQAVVKLGVITSRGCRTITCSMDVVCSDEEDDDNDDSVNETADTSSSSPV
jgi:hypothetical protein